MHREKIVRIVLIFVSLFFSIWFFGKSFGYDSDSGNMWVAKNQVGDFGLHISLIRSFSLGNNFPPQSPFFPGNFLSYHYLFDLIVGLIVRLGMRIDLSLNGASVIAMTTLLYFIFQISQIVFGRNHRIGYLSVIFFLAPGGGVL